MEKHRMAVVGIGATGSVLAAALLSKYPETVLVGRKPDLGNQLKEKGIAITGVIDYHVPVNNYSSNIEELKGLDPDIIFLCTKTFHLGLVLEKLQDILLPSTKIISTQNGLGAEDLIAAKFGDQTVFRMSLNYGALQQDAGEVQTTFFNRPNHLGCISEENQALGLRIADILTGCGLDTEFVDNIKLFVWKKMIMKCTMASICAVTNRTIKECLDFPPTREIADACFKEALSVAKTLGYDLGEDYLRQALSYLEQVGLHKDSMCSDLEHQTQTEIDFLGGKIVEYGRANGINTPYYVTMTNLVKAFEDRYLKKR